MQIPQISILTAKANMQRQVSSSNTHVKISYLKDWEELYTYAGHKDAIANWKRGTSLIGFI